MATDDPILDAPLAPAYPTGYQFWIAHWLQIIDAARAWYHEATGRDPANSDIAHGLWRALNEGERWRTLRRAFQDTWPLPVPEPAPVTLGSLTIDGQFFRQGGERFTLIDTSEFSVFKRFLDGEDVLPVLRERQELGFNSRRVWLLNQSVVGYRHLDWRKPYADQPAPDAGIHPAQYANYYAQLHTFVQLLGSVGAIAHLTVFTQTLDLMPLATDRQRHLDATADAVRGLPNVLLSLANEIDAHDNAAILDQLVRPSGVLISRGSNGSDAVPPHHDAPWDFEEYHTNDLDEWQRKVGHNAMEWADQSGVPCVSSENTRYPDRDSSTVHAEDAGENAALLCAGACYHSQSGKFSTLFDPIERMGAQYWVGGVLQVPLEFQSGQYFHRPEFEAPGIIRVHGRRLPDGREYDCYVRA